jgi:hypothetical protein
MHCTEFEDRLNELLDERQPLTADTVLSAHASACAECAARLRGYETMCAGLSLLKVPTTSPDFTARVLQAVSAPTTIASVLHPVDVIPQEHASPATHATPLIAATPGGALGRSWAGWALAASLAAVGLVAWSFLNGQHGNDPVVQVAAPVGKTTIEKSTIEKTTPNHGGTADGTEQVADTGAHQASEDNHAPPAATIPPPALGALAAEARGHWLALAGHTRADVSDALRIVPLVSSMELTSVDTAANNTAEKNGWTSDLAEGLRPVTNTTSGAFEGLWRALPTQEEKPRL